MVLGVSQLNENERMLVGMLAAICCSGGKRLQEPSVFGPGLSAAARILKGATTAADIRRGLEALTDAMSLPRGDVPASYCDPEPPENQ